MAGGGNAGADNLALRVQRLQLGAAGGLHRRRVRRPSASASSSAGPFSSGVAVPRAVPNGAGRLSQQQTEIRELMLQSFQSSDQSTFLLEGENGHPAPGFQVAFGNTLESGAHLLAVVDEEGMISIIDTSEHGQREHTPPRTSILQSVQRKWVAHRNAVFDVIWSHDDRQLLTASGDLFVSGWDVESQRSVFKLRGHQMSVKCVRQVPHQKHLFASGARDGNVLIWDTRTDGKPVASLMNVHGAPEHANAHSSVFASPSSARKRRRLSVASSPRSVTCIEFGANGHELVTAGALDSVVKFWDVRRLTTAHHFKPSAFSSRPVRTTSCSSRVGTHHGISSLAFDHTKSKLLVNVLNDAIKIIDVNAAANAEPIAQCSGHLATSFYVKAAFSPESDFIIGGSADGAAYIWNATTTSSTAVSASSARFPRAVLKGHTSEVNGVAWHKHDFTKVASCSDDGTVRCWTLGRLHSEDQETPRFVLKRDADSWSNWQDFCAQPDGVSYAVLDAFLPCKDEGAEASMEVAERGEAEGKSPLLIRRSGELLRGPRADAQPTPTRRPTPSPPQTLLDFWRR